MCALPIFLGDLAADLVETAVPRDADPGRGRFGPAQFGRHERIARAGGAAARDLAIFDLGRDPGDGVGERKGRIPAETIGFARLARFDARILDLRERFERVGEFEIELRGAERSEGHTSELQSLMRISYAVF